ncbi:MAG: hypothetical protein ACRC9P_09185, partial [Bacteroides sp.]
ELKDASQNGYEVWQGYFIVQDSIQIPLIFGVESETAIQQLRIYSGSELAYWSYWHEKKDPSTHIDSVSFKCGPNSEFRGVRKNNQIAGSYFEGIYTKKERAKFVAQKVDKQRPLFPKVANPSNISPTGTWILDFGTLKDLSEPAELLRYNIDRVQTFDLYRSKDNIIGKAYGAKGVQGLSGVMSTKGFICASFHHSEPFLIEATFIDENTFDATISSSTDTYKLRGRRKSQIKENFDYTCSLIRGLYLNIKGFFNP